MASKIATLIAYAAMISPMAAGDCTEPSISYDLTRSDVVQIAKITYSIGHYSFERAKILSTEFDPKSEQFKAAIMFVVEQPQDGIEMQALFTCEHFAKEKWSCESKKRTMLSELDECNSMIEVIGKPPVSSDKMREIVTAAVKYFSRHNSGQPTEIVWSSGLGFTVKFESGVCAEWVPVVWDPDDRAYQVPNPTTITEQCS